MIKLTVACWLTTRPLAVQAALAQIVAVSDAKAGHALVLDDARVEHIAALNDAIVDFVGFSAVDAYSRSQR